MNSEEILQAIKELASQQGFYTSIYEALYSLSEDKRNEALAKLEAENFKDVVDLALYLEG